MKNKVFIVTLLGLALMLSACQKKDSKTTLPAAPATNGTTNSSANDTATTNEANKVTPANTAAAPGEDNSKETPADATANTSQSNEDEPKLVSEDTLKTKEFVQTLMKKSHYISKIKITKESDGKEKMVIMDNFKGNLSAIEMPTPEGLELNREYLIFYKDDLNGEIVPTNGKQSYIQVANSNDAILEYVEGVYKAKEEVAPATTNTKESTEKATTDNSKDKPSVNSNTKKTTDTKSN